MKIGHIILAIFTSAAFLLFCRCLMMTWNSKNFKKRIRRGEVGMTCKYWIGENAYYDQIEKYLPKSDQVILKKEILPQYVNNIEPAGSWRTKTTKDAK